MKKLNTRFVVIVSALLASAVVVGESMLSAQTTQGASSVHSIPYPQVAPPTLNLDFPIAKKQLHASASSLVVAAFLFF